MHLATLLSKTKSAEGVELLKAIQKNEGRRGRGDWRVQVNLVRAFAALAAREDDVMEPLVSYLGSSTDHVTISTLAALAGLPKETVKKYEDGAGLRKKLEQLGVASKKRSEAVRGEALVALAKHFPDEFKYDGLLADKKSSLRLKAKVLEAMSSIPAPNHLAAMLERLDDDSVRISMAAWDFIRKLLQRSSFRTIRKDTAVTNELGNKLFRKAKISLLREDMAVTTLVANALGDSAVFSFLVQDGFDARAVEELMLAYTKFSAPNDVEAMQAILETLGKLGDQRAVPLLERAVLDPDRTVGLAAAAALKRLTGTSYDDQVTRSTKPLHVDYSWKTLEGIPKNQKAAIKTSKGTITIQFLKDDAPFTVLSFYKLIRKRFFNRLSFHRVVPNFVVQGGDPRGDGWGGPNYAVRSEFSYVNFDRGAVGVASAGKDTEGCQFFITHSPQPHLDGRYTVFAKVVAGMDVVDKIQIGDEILSITLSSN
jgi:cyclophilin family peptidyl-prolyl cis-trans isomerase